MYESYMGAEHNTKMTKDMSDDDKKAYTDYEGKERAEHDVKILAEGNEIRADKDRLKMAVHCAKMQKEYLNDIG